MGRPANTLVRVRCWVLSRCPNRARPHLQGDLAIILEKILDHYESDDKEMKRRRKPGSGNPTGSAFGKCAAQMVLHRYPLLGKPEEYRARTLMTFEEGDRVEAWLKAMISSLYPGMVGSAQGLTYLDVDLTDEEIAVLRPHIGGDWGDSDRIWGEVRSNFPGGRPRVDEDGRLIARQLNPKAGFILDPVKKKLWAPIYVDFAAKTEDRGHVIVEIKSASDGTFRRAMLGELDASKKAQAAGIVEATGLPFVMIMSRKMTSHLLEISYLPTLAGDVQVRIMKSNRTVEEFRVTPGTDRVATVDGQPASLPPDQEWEIGEVWTPHDPGLLAEIRRRIKVVLLWRPGDSLPREAGPSFRCSKCWGRGTKTCGQCHGTGVTAKLKKTCGPCGGAKTVSCETCAGKGQLDEAPLPPMPCSYSIHAETPVLKADYTWARAEKIAEGDALFGVEEATRPRGRRVTPTVVVAAAARLKETVVITTGRGRIVCSPEHPWLVEMGTRPAEWPCRRREGVRWVKGGAHWREAGEIYPGMLVAHICYPYEALAGMTEDYMAGYICGLVEGDGHVSRVSRAPRVCVAMTDAPALDRLVEFLRAFGVPSRRKTRDLSRQGVKSFKSRKPIEDITFGGRVGAPTTDTILRWALTTPAAAAGYLGGLYDAEGGLQARSLRIYQRDDSPVVPRAIAAAAVLGLDLRVEPWRKGNRGAALRLYTHDGLSGLARFFTITRPAIKRKTSLLGRSLCGSWARVLSVEPGPATPMVDIQTSSKTFIAGGFVSHNCAVKEACYGEPLAATGIEGAFQLLVSEGKAPKWMVKRKAWEKAGLGFVTPPSQRKPELPMLGLPTTTDIEDREAIAAAAE